MKKDLKINLIFIMVPLFLMLVVVGTVVFLNSVNADRYIKMLKKCKQTPTKIAAKQRKKFLGYPA